MARKPGPHATRQEALEWLEAQPVPANELEHQLLLDTAFLEDRLTRSEKEVADLTRLLGTTLGRVAKIETVLLSMGTAPGSLGGSL